MPASTQNPRNKALLKLTLIILLAGIALIAYWLLFLKGQESTDDAYAAGNQIPLSAQVGGTITALYAEDTQHVQAGQLLVELDPADATLALARASADLAQTVRQTRTLITGESKLVALLAERSSTLARAQGDLKRREQARQDDAIGQEELQHAREAVTSARAAVQIAEAELKAQRELVMSDTVAKHPQVARSAALVREAALALERTRIRAPVQGQIARRSAQPGMRIQPGTPLMALVPMNTIWVDANFKESQLKNLRIGQSATVHADVYGNDVSYRGTVMGLAAGTGSVFSLLPPQNATGNWIKVVQRVPVRIALNAEDLQKHPLRLGLSMNVSVDISDSSGPMISHAPTGKPQLATDIYADQLQHATQLVAKIIAANLGH
ncbi:HlyD family efflux transporter periplasmic adaptor subunit [Craterilacuibacter sp. RT1T]|uniref:HlyD family efflux transporter periplasmic adaptor subunit n=1 Tax=Craterilacuibacter sp. RT1T TaxID=2942211 RepID=UPI0020C155A2|nr:HlyD family efflux transporter periplasmic adaptor subunit [Craterilacuibacter sp. RT1T]MCL6264744.1 HlyD family efflux transporter periplasmic adaptor subunit [Craterilacuibacter sp. RT1T]